jgi:hypothetical protein
MQRQSIEKMREDAKNRTPTENIEAALDAMEKFYGFDQASQEKKQGQQQNKTKEVLPPPPPKGWRDTVATTLSSLGARA